MPRLTAPPARFGLVRNSVSARQAGLLASVPISYFVNIFIVFSLSPQTSEPPFLEKSLTTV